MLSADIKKSYYKALIGKDPDYDGVFYVGVKSTGVFCRSVCPARKPKFENCEFFENAEEALLAGFRSCRRCSPLSHPNEISEVVRKLVQAIIPGKTTIIDSIDKELNRYFKGTLERFFTPIKMIGTPFQKSVWFELKKIPIGETRSYSYIAKGLGNLGAVRAVGSANGANQLAIVIPCHRVINTDGQIGGYGGGLARKKWLLEHEDKYGKR